MDENKQLVEGLPRGCAYYGYEKRDAIIFYDANEDWPQRCIEMLLRCARKSATLTVVFSEAVTGFGPEDVVLSGTAPGPMAATVTGSNTTYNVAVAGMTGGGTVVAAVGPAAHGIRPGPATTLPRARTTR